MVIESFERRGVPRSGIALKKAIKYTPLYKLIRGQNIAAQGIYLEITDLCDMSCPMCNTRQHREGGQGPVLTPREIREKIFSHCHYLGFRDVTISGGEPTLAPHLREVIGDAVRMGYRVFLVSNMLRGDEGLWRNILTLMRDPRHTVLVSFDSSVESEMNAIRGADVFARVVDNSRKIVQLRNGLKAGTQLKAAIVLQPRNARSLMETVDYLLNDIRFDKVLIQPRHDYSRVTLMNYRRQARAGAYTLSEREELIRASELLFRKAAEDPRIVPTRGPLGHWVDFYTNPLKIRKMCESTALIYVDAYGNLRGCLSGDTLGTIRDTSIACFLKSKQYRRFLMFARICNICVHGCS